MITIRDTRRIAVLVALALAVGCSTTRDVEVPVELPDTFAVPESAEPAGPAVTDGRWWQDFNDPSLNALVEESVTDNLDIEQAWARIEQFNALADQAGSANWPQLNAQFNAGRSRGYDFLGNPSTNNQYGLSLAAAYEVDLWGKVAASSDAVGLDAMATREDLGTIAMTVTSQVAEIWYQLVEVNAQLKLLEQQVEVNERLLELVKLRFSHGLTSALDVQQQQQQLQSIGSQTPLLETRRALLQHQLSMLLGDAPGSRQFPEVTEFPELPPLPAAGVPSELVARRPDLRSAHLRVQAADRRVAAAVADKFPALRLTASTGYAATSLDELIDRWIWSIGSSLVLPIIDGNRRAAEVDRQEAVLRERLGGFGSAALRALKEVMDALIAEDRQRAYLQQLEAQLELSNSLLALAEQRYVQGLVDYLPVLNALGTTQRQETAVITARRQLISYRIQLCRALGGSWTQDLNDSSEETP